MGNPNEFASAIERLLDPEQSCVTGHAIGVDGGLSRIRSLPIVEEGRLVGVITLENMTEYMMIHAALDNAKKKRNGRAEMESFNLGVQRF